MSMWIGTYARNGGKGLHPLSIAQGQLMVGPPLPEIANASYGVWNRQHRVAYFVDEQDAGRVAAWRREERRWSALSHFGSCGGAPCYLGLAPDAGWLAVANYADGTVGLLSLDRASGAIGELVDLARPSGRGVDPERQDGPHAHCVLFDEGGQWLYHVDLGLDRILAYPLGKGRLGDPELAFAAPAGSGPRHLVLHPDRRRAFLICELSAELHLLERDGPTFRSLASRPTSPRQQDDNLGGHLALIDADRLAVTNRGDDNLTVFALGAGTADRAACIPSKGSSPRHFWSNGSAAVIANEKSGSIALVDLGRPQVPAVTAEVPGACFIFELPDGD